MILKPLVILIIFFFLIIISCTVGYCIGYVKGSLDTQDRLITDLGHLFESFDLNIENLNLDFNETKLVDYVFQLEEEAKND